MISKEDALNILKEMDEIEQKMKRNYIDLESKVKDPKLKEAFSSLADDEDRHSRLVNELEKLLQTQ
ncbi:MAG TPA: ferritin family protein [Chlamydiales bacterium]|nr:ferritin family protein [Chlamydiales bacterium]